MLHYISPIAIYKWVWLYSSSMEANDASKDDESTIEFAGEEIAVGDTVNVTFTETQTNSEHTQEGKVSGFMFERSRRMPTSLKFEDGKHFEVDEDMVHSISIVE